jgi:predicted AAA+ superfamily ATPase
MFERLIIQELEQWQHKSSRKPLVIRGARQVGKTTVVHQFAERFEQYIYLNLELEEDKQPFLRFTNIETLLQNLFFLKDQSLSLKANTLIFIDEIQEVPEALNVLRYFYEQEPSIKVIAAGSMLETAFDKNIHFPVGRVEFKVLRPVAFPEFLDALGERGALEQLFQVPIRDFAHDKLLKLYHLYALIGGMPEVIKTYVATKDLNALQSVFDSLITSYLEDVEKYAKNNSQALHLAHIIRTSFAEAGNRIQFAGFGNSPYRSREMSESFRVLEKVFLLNLVYPNTSVTLPILPDLKKSPRLQLLDTGLMNYFVGIQKDIIGTDDLSQVYKGKMIEHLTGQELLAAQYHALAALNFWVKAKKESTAELDFLISFDGQIIPVEVKSGKTGTLRSLHQFMDLAPHNMSVRLYAGNLSISELITPNGKTFFLLNLPYYLASQLMAYLEWFRDEINQRNQALENG